MGARYFVRSSPEGPEKGPYTVDLIKNSYERNMLKDDAMCRLDGGSSWISIRNVLELPTPGAPRNVAFSSSSDAQREMDSAHARQYQQAGGSSNMTIGLIMVVAGLVLTAVSFSASGGGGVLFIGLVIFGFIRIIRGAGSS